MNDLFDSMQEHQAERMAIMQESGVPDAAEKAADDLHRHEIASVIRKYFPNGKAAADYFDLVEKHRGKAPAEKLRADCRIAWKQHAIDLQGQA